VTGNRKNASDRTGKTSRRGFLKIGAQASGLILGHKMLKFSTVEASVSEPGTLLKNGLIVDGTGKKGEVGNLLIRGTKIEEVSPGPISVDCETIDCTGKVIAPGFIDVHSHMDWVLPIEGREDMKSPFTAQGCTTFVAGNCGYGAAGFRKNSRHKSRIKPVLFGGSELGWDTMEEYFAHLRKVGLSHNLVTMAGHGTIRASIRGFDPSSPDDEEMKELLALVEAAMDQGAWGASFGLQYAPGIFAKADEVEQIARLTAKKGKIVTVHGRAYSSVSGAYEIKKGGTPHNVLALQQMIDVAKATGVRLQYSHLMFAGTASHQTYEQCLEVLDKARADGVDVMIDTYPYHCGTSVISVVIPPWFLANVPANYRDEKALKRLEAELNFMSMALGFGYDDIQLTNAQHPDLNEYTGLFLAEIADKRGMKPFDVAIEIAEKSGGIARVLNHKYSNMEIIEALMKYDGCLFMTDATPAPEGVQNPAAFGSFPLLLQYARDRKLLSLEEAVRKMTGANAERVNLKDRGFLKKGLAADITVFDWNAVKDNNTVTDTDNAPTGIETVFINGRRVKKNGKVDGSITAGEVLLS
jgi:N-acyl-D-amino-acid deacylase